MDRAIEERIYAGVLGKILGSTTAGRSRDGATSGSATGSAKSAISSTTSSACRSCSRTTTFPGTFAFFRALEDNGYPKDLSPAMVGRTWLNYIIEEEDHSLVGRPRTLDRAHRLPAPEERHRGTGERQSRPQRAWIPAQIGAEIFMDAFAMAAPGDPDRAVRHGARRRLGQPRWHRPRRRRLAGGDGGAGFRRRRHRQALRCGPRYVTDPHLLGIVDAIRNQCAGTDDWRVVRQWIADHHGYDHYDGPCHMVPNHAIVLMALLMAGDDFGRSLTIATSSGWDTDCNAGNVGCLNGIRLGLAALDKGPDLRRPVSDFMYVVTSDGAAGITDAVQETRRIAAAARAIRANRQPRCRHATASTTQARPRAFSPAPATPSARPWSLSAMTARASASHWGTLARRQRQRLDAGFVEPFAASSSFAMVASPTLYSGQTVTAILAGDAAGVRARLYALYYDREDAIERLDGDWTALRWEKPGSSGRSPIPMACRSIGSAWSSRRIAVSTARS